MCTHGVLRAGSLGAVSRSPIGGSGWRSGRGCSDTHGSGRLGGWGPLSPEAGPSLPHGFGSWRRGAQGSREPTHGCSQGLKGDLVAPGELGLGLAWTRNLLCGVFREREFGPREQILDQMTTGCWGPGPGNAVMGSGLGGCWLRDPLPIPRDSKPVRASSQLCWHTLSAKLWPATGLAMPSARAEMGSSDRPLK